MAWKMVGEPKTRKLTRGLSDEFSGMTPAPHDRPLNPTRSAVLKSAVDKGEFRTCEWASAYCEETKQTYRVNGKHTSTLLSSMNGEFPKGLSVIVEHYHCDTMADVAALYCTFDRRISSRSSGDINRIWSATCNALDDVSPRFVDIGITGISYFFWEDGATHHPAEERAQLCIAYSEFICWISDLMSGLDVKKTKHMRRGPVVAAMFATWKKSKSLATEFWTAVRDATGAKPDVADRKLEKYLSAISIRGNHAGATVVSPREAYCKCVHAWNAWRDGQKTDLKYYPAAKTPIAK